MQQIRSEFGENASILETRTKRSPFLRRTRFEVTASSYSRMKELEREAHANESSTSFSQPASNNSSSSKSVAGDTIEKNDNSLPVPLDSNNSNERETSEEFLVCSSASDEIPLSTMARRASAQVFQELIEAGIDRGIAHQWVEAACATCDPSVLQSNWTLKAEIQSWVRGFMHAAKPLDLQSKKSQILAFVGPTGSGKTTTLAKIASCLSMDHNLTVGVLSLGFQANQTSELLNTYANLLGWDFLKVEAIEELKSATERMSNKQFVLIDTPGCSPTDELALTMLDQWLAAIVPTTTFLVVSSTSSERAFLRCEESFGAMNPNSWVLTKLDEAGGIGALFPCLQSSSIPISYLTNGQHIPADLIPASSMKLAQHVLSG